MLPSPRVIGIPNEVRDMKIKFALFLALVFVCGCIPALANATYTNGFDSEFGTGCCHVSPFGGPPPIPLVQYSGDALLQGLNFVTYTYPDTVQVWMQVDFSALVSSFSETVNCYTIPASFCVYDWQGTFNGGSVPITATIVGGSFPNNTFTYLTFAGSITGGTFAGEFDTYCSPCLPGDVDLRLNLAGIWSNGWKSQGSLDLYTDYDGTGGGMILSTTVPEPGSLLFLGSGLTLLASALRRKLL